MDHGPWVMGVMGVMGETIHEGKNESVSVRSYDCLMRIAAYKQLTKKGKGPGSIIALVATVVADQADQPTGSRSYTSTPYILIPTPYLPTHNSYTLTHSLLSLLLVS